MTLINKRLKHMPTLVVSALLCAAPALKAAPVSFGISAATISAGSGYGMDASENGSNGSLLDVRFDTTSFSPQSLSLAGVGDSTSFVFATIKFNEPNTGSGANQGIRSGELDGLGLTASFSFTDPVAGAIALTGLGTATTGRIDDDDPDYAIAWNPVEADFGAGGRFRISVNALSFSNAGSQTASATVELLSMPSELRVAAVPEPTSIALVGVALAGAGVARRRRKV
jgi:hypothetical protein